MSLIPQYPLSEFKNLRSSQIRRLKSCELMADGEYLCTVIIPSSGGGLSITDHIKTQAEYLGISSNSVGGQVLAQIQEVRNASK